MYFKLNILSLYNLVKVKNKYLRIFLFMNKNKFK